MILPSSRSLSGMSFRGSTLSKWCFALSVRLIFVISNEYPPIDLGPTSDILKPLYASEYRLNCDKPN